MLNFECFLNTGYFSAIKVFSESPLKVGHDTVDCNVIVAIRATLNFVLVVLMGQVPGCTQVIKFKICQHPLIQIKLWIQKTKVITMHRKTSVEISIKLLFR